MAINCVLHSPTGKLQAHGRLLALRRFTNSLLVVAKLREYPSWCLPGLLQLSVRQTQGQKKIHPRVPR